jgi:hypothetical protein
LTPVLSPSEDKMPVFISVELPDLLSFVLCQWQLFLYSATLEPTAHFGPMPIPNVLSVRSMHGLDFTFFIYWRNGLQ